MEKKNFAKILEQKSWLISLVILLLVFFQTCSNNKRISALEKTVTKTTQENNDKIVNEFKIEGLRISKRFLYDNNSIIRTTIRPDDRMNQYDEEIKKLEK